MKTARSFFKRHQKRLAIISIIYILIVILTHWQLPQHFIWPVAALLSVSMNFVYLTEAYHRREFLRVEAFVSYGLITLSVMGVFFTPLFLIFAIFAHGLWDLAKHRGAGVPFFNWYILSCFWIDLIYSVTLLFYWLSE